MTQAAMIIHTRTRLCDFPSALAVCPSSLSSGDAQKVRKRILAATRSIDIMGQNEVRRMIYTCGDLVVAGMVSFLKNFSDNNVDDEKFFYDEVGRGIYAFVGFVFQAKNQNTPLIDKKILWDNFKNYMEPVWEWKVLDTQSSNFAEIDFSSANAKESISSEVVSDMTLYTTGATDAAIFSYWLGQALKGNSVSFCSNITDFKVVKDRTFNIITTTTNIIERIKREVPSQHKDQSPPIHSTTENTHYNKQKKNLIPNETSIAGKSFKNMWLIVGVVLIILVFMVLLLK